MLYFLTNVEEYIKDLEVFKDFFAVLLKILLPLAISFIVSGYVGLERQNVGKAAGISAHMLVGLSATGVAILNRLMYDWQIQQAISDVYLRPEGQRIIAQVLAGVGFIGAGVILKDDHNIIRGLTTAATIWSVAIVGIIVGSGYIFLGSLLGLTIVLFITTRDFSRGVNPLVKIHHLEHEKEKINDK